MSRISCSQRLYYLEEIKEHLSRNRGARDALAVLTTALPWKQCISWAIQIVAHHLDNRRHKALDVLDELGSDLAHSPIESRRLTHLFTCIIARKFPGIASMRTLAPGCGSRKHVRLSKHSLKDFRTSLSSLLSSEAWLLYPYHPIDSPRTLF